MPSFELTKEADSDIEGIARYTIKQWGENQAKLYLNKIGEKEIQSKSPLKKYPRVKCTRSEHHFIFCLHPQKKNERPIILGVLHERMDLLNRLKNRLE